MNPRALSIVRFVVVWALYTAAVVACGGRLGLSSAPVTNETCASLFPIRQGGVCLVLSADPSQMIERLDLQDTQLRRESTRFILWIPGVDCKSGEVIAKQAAPFHPLGRPLCFTPR